MGPERAPGLLRPARSGEEDLPAALHEREPDPRGKMALAAARRAEEEQIGARGEPGSATAMTWALETIGTASKSKVSSVLPGGRRASARWRSSCACPPSRRSGRPSPIRPTRKAGRRPASSPPSPSTSSPNATGAASLASEPSFAAVTRHHRTSGTESRRRSHLTLYQRSMIDQFFRAISERLLPSTDLNLVAKS